MIQSNAIHKSILYLLLIISVQVISAQNSIGANGQVALSAFEHFQQNDYHGVIRVLQKQSNRSPQEEILFEISRFKTGQSNGEKIRIWIGNHKDHPLQSLAKFNYAAAAYYRGDTLTSSNYFSSIAYDELSRSDQVEYGFIYGLINLQKKQHQKAIKLFEIADKNGYDDKSQLSYYQGFTYYHLTSYTQAMNALEQVDPESSYNTSARLFMAKILLEQGKIDQVISLSKEELTEEKSKMNSGFHQLIGEAYAIKGDKSKADAYLDQAIKMHPSRPTPALYYQAGVAKFKIGNEDKALEYLTQAGIGSGEYAQLSAFQLGRLHVRRKEFENALTAYIEASSSSDKAIKEESIYHAAKLNADLKNYASSIQYANDYLSHFPNGQWSKELKNLIAQLYLRTSNYDLAIQHLESLGLIDEEQKAVYQKVTFLKGQLLFNDGDFKKALFWFQKSSSFPVDRPLADESHGYIGEIYLREDAYKNAIISYNKAIKKTPAIHYGIGYALFNQQLYQEAIPYFRKAAETYDATVRRDAQLRLADCLYATKVYEQSLKIYESLASSDYIFFQRGMVLMNLNRKQEALNSLQKVGWNTPFGDDATFYQAQMAFESADFDTAVKGFTQVIKRYDTSPFIARSYLNRAIANNNLGNLQVAGEDYVYVIEHFIDTEEAYSAILGLQDLQQKGIKTGDLDRFISNYKKANPDDNSLEAVEFGAAKASYFDLNYENAISRINDFLSDYPQSTFKQEAEFYLADAHFRLNQLEQAKTLFDRQKALRNTYTGRILNRLGEVNMQLKVYDEAIDAYKLLEDLNVSPKETYNARNGLMIAYFQSSKYGQAIEMADRILADEWKPVNGSQLALRYKAISLYELNDYSAAKEVFTSLSTGSDRLAAEANYYIGLMLFQESRHEESLDRLFDLNAKFGSYTDWIDRSYLLIADNYISTDQLFQAKATLRSIIQHSSNMEVVKQAQTKLDAIEQSLTTDSIKTQNE